MADPGPNPELWMSVSQSSVLCRGFYSKI